MSMQNLRSSLRALVGAAAASLALAATPAVAQVIQLADGTNPTPVPACPGGTLVQVNAFTLQFTGTGTGPVLGIRLGLSPLGSYQLIDSIEIRNGATAIGSIVPTSDYPTIRLNTTLNVPTGALPLTIWVKIKDHAFMPPPGAGGQQSVSVAVDSVASMWSTTGTDSSPAVPINNNTPANVVWNTVTPGATNVAASWKGAAQNVVVLRQVAGPVTDVPVEGQSYPTAGGLMVKDTIVATGSMTSFNDTTAKAGKANFYKVFVRDSCGNWSTGATIGPVYPGGVAEGATSGNGPVVGILNPVGGTVTSPFKVQARVFSPSGTITTVVVEADDGVAASPLSFTLTRNANYGVAADNGIFEATISTLTAGKNYTLRAKATNGAGTVASNAVGVQVTAGKGDGHLLVRDNSSQLCDDCHGGSLKTHASESTGTKYGSWYVGCRGCHTPHSTTNAALVEQQITPPAVNGQWPPAKTLFSTRTGFDPAAGATNSATVAAATYANGDRTGPCQVCHTRTDHYRRNGEPVAHFSSKCTQCHSHTGGFGVTGGCTTCHGAATRTDGLPLETPPNDTCGSSTGTRIGAHVKHLSTTAGTFTDGVTCAQCHTDPPTRPTHPGTSCSTDPAQRAVMTWGSVATGTVSPWSGAVSPSYDYGTQTCNNTYCHGAFKKQPGLLPPYTSSVGWNAAVGCGSCHGTPPGGTHATSTNCASCHGAGYDLAGITGAAKITHVNGLLEVTGGTSCQDCHGDKNRLADAFGDTFVVGTTTYERYKGAPPAQAGIPGVTNPTPDTQQAHLQHTYSSKMTTRRPLMCDACHPVTTSLGHADSNLDMTWGPLAQTGAALVTYTGSPGFNCTNYCHGSAFPADTKGSLTSPPWTSIDGSYKACGACHGSPPPNPKHLSLTSRAITTAASCNSCHPATVTGTGAIDLAGGKHVDGIYLASVTCTSCHGTPPTSTANLADFNNANGVGGHPQHAVAPLQTRTAAFACTTCHPNNTSMTHATGTPDMTFAASFAGSTTWRNPTSDCTTSYCHGDTSTVAPIWKAGAPVAGLNSVAQGTWGGAAKQPVWTNVTGTYRACSACHRSPPLLSASNPHPTNTNCTDCHPAGSSQTTMTGAAAATHVDGHVDLTHTGCTACHGDLTADLVAFNDTRAMPGFNANAHDVAGFVTTTVAGVGAHMKHLVGTTFKTTNGGKGAVCVDCHQVPGTGDIAHATGTSGIAGQLSRATVTFNNVAKTGLASGGTPLASVYSNSTTAAGGTTSGTCNSVYCHGGKWDADLTGKKGTNVRPRFTDGAMNCGSCHASPPTNNTHTGVLGVKNCNVCHPGTSNGYFCQVNVVGVYTGCVVDQAQHINGNADSNLTCTSCHGQPPTSLATLTDPAHNPTGIGAHSAHVNQTNLRSAAFTCAVCHGSVPPDTTHVGGTIDIGWTVPATSGITPSPTTAQVATGAWQTTPTCTNYCHTPSGAQLGGSNRTPSWTGGPSQAACGTCHGAPPPVDATAAADHPQNTNCAVCHGTGYATTGLTGAAKTTHINESTRAGVDKPANGCTACHGVLAGVAGAAVANTDPSAAPGYSALGVDTVGTTARSSPGVGAHDAHLRPSTGLNAIAPVPCATCHAGFFPGPGDTLHANGNTEVGWAALVSSTGIVVAPAAGTIAAAWENSPTPTCTNYCHSNAAPVGRTKTTASPSWKSTTALTCTSCHQVQSTVADGTSLSLGHRLHITTVAGGGYFYNCNQCHSTVANGQSDGTGTSIITAANHVSGTHTVAFNAAFNPGATSYNQGPSYTCANTYCHSNGTNAATPPANTSILWTATKTCSSCHGYNAADPVVVGSTLAGQKLGSIKHLNHVANAALIGRNYFCGDCHSNTVQAGTDATMASTAVPNHVNRAKDVSMVARGGKSNGTILANGNCAASYCHSSGQRTPVFEPVNWTSAPWAGSICDKCHGAYSAADGAAFGFVSVAGEPNYANGGQDTATANSHGKHVPSYACNVCHFGFVNPAGTAIVGTSHTDGAVQMALSTTVAGAGATYTPGAGMAGSCSASKCHGSGTPKWGGPAQKCSDCHTGAADTDSFAFGTPGVISSTEWVSVGHGQASIGLPSFTGGTPCLYCHDGNVGHDIAGNPFRLRGRSNAAGGATFDPYASGTVANNVCLNCHGTGSNGVDPADGGANGTNPFKTGATKVDAFHGGSLHIANNGGNRCWDCHDPHGDGANIKMVSKSLVQNATDANSFAATRQNGGTGIVFTGGTTGTDYAGAAAKVCNACHQTTKYYRTGGTNGGHMTNAKCSICHQHNQTPNKAFAQAVSCTGCHYAPPTASGRHTAHDETAFTEASYTNKDRHAAAGQYGFACGTCHNGTHWDSDNAFTVQVVFNGFDSAPVVSVTGTYTRSGAQTLDPFTNPEGTLNYRWYNGTCNGVYCHSNAAPIGGKTNTFATPSWNEAAWTAANKCTKCHQMTSTPADPTSLSSGHRIHVQGTASAGYFFACQSCHNTVATGASDYPTTAGVILDKRQHVSGSHSLTFDPTVNPSVGGGVRYNSGPFTCTNTYCHSIGTSTTTVANVSIAWTATNKTCSSCHGFNAADPVVIGSTLAGQKLGSIKHLNHIANAALIGSNFRCGDCHSNTVQAGTDATMASTALPNHVNRAKDVAMVARGAKSNGTYLANGNCSASYCHSSGQRTPVFEPVGWTSVAWVGSICNKCHGAYSAADGASFGWTAVAGEPNYANGGQNTATANSHRAHVSGADDCFTCHKDTTLTGFAIKQNGVHLTGGIDVSFATTLAGNPTYVAGNGSTTSATCTNVSCHGGSGTVTWGGPTMTCRGCHLAAAGTINVTTDVNDYVYGNGSIAKIDPEEWLTAGHGTRTAFLESGNPGPNFDNLPTNNVDGCYYCHDTAANGGAGHGDTTNPFRLKYTTGPDGKIGVCLQCHKSASAGVTVSGQLRNGTLKISATHYGADHTAAGGHKGGQYCWDCHDPHGDYNTTKNARLAYMIHEEPVEDHTATTGPTDWGIPRNAADLGMKPDFRMARSAPTASWNWADYVSSTLTNGNIGVCQACHTSAGHFNNTAWVTTAGGDSTHNATTVCVTCHMHQQGTTDAFKANGDCTGCHTNTQAITVGPALGGTRRAITGEFSNTWSHKRSATPVGTVNKFDCVVCHMEGNPATGDQSGVHGDGYVNLRDPDTGVQIRDVTYTAASGSNPGSYASAGTDAVFGQWSRDLSSATIEDKVAAVMINQCLHCHDANGAQNSNAWVGGGAAGKGTGATTGSAGKPFGMTIAGTGYNGVNMLTACSGAPGSNPSANGCVVNVDASFLTTNASYHPIKGQQNNWYAKDRRMRTPWNMGVTTRAGTVNLTTWGPRITCWDCHAANRESGSAGPSIKTVTAHGGPQTIRQDVWVQSTNRAGAVGAGNLCLVCHNVPASGSTHGSLGTYPTGASAWTTTGRAEPATLARNACYVCHASAIAKPTRPLPAQDAHGFDRFAYTTGTDTLWPAGATNTYRPFAFFRSAGSAGTWNSTISWRPLSGAAGNGASAVPAGSATCGNGALSTTAAGLAGTSDCNDNHGPYSPGGTY